VRYVESCYGLFGLAPVPGGDLPTTLVRSQTQTPRAPSILASIYTSASLPHKLLLLAVAGAGENSTLSAAAKSERPSEKIAFTDRLFMSTWIPPNLYTLRLSKRTYGARPTIVWFLYIHICIYILGTNWEHQGCAHLGRSRGRSLNSKVYTQYSR